MLQHPQNAILVLSNSDLAGNLPIGYVGAIINRPAEKCFEFAESQCENVQFYCAGGIIAAPTMYDGAFTELPDKAEFCNTPF